MKNNKAILEMCNEKIPQTYIEVCGIIKERIKNISFCIIAIGGVSGAGKTHLARYLSWMLKVSILETDLFLHRKETKWTYDYKYIQDILENKKVAQRHIIVEGCSILPVLRKFDSSEIFLIYIEKQKTSGYLPVDQFYSENTKTCSIKEILDVDCPSFLIEEANHTISWEAH